MQKIAVQKKLFFSPFFLTEKKNMFMNRKYMEEQFLKRYKKRKEKKIAIKIFCTQKTTRGKNPNQFNVNLASMKKNCKLK